MQSDWKTLIGGLLLAGALMDATPMTEKELKEVRGAASPALIAFLTQTPSVLFANGVRVWASSSPFEGLMVNFSYNNGTQAGQGTVRIPQ